MPNNQKPSKPNILWILADQHRQDCLGVYGNRDVRTPHLDALAQDGVMFQNSFCTSPICTPSRYSLLTGLAVHQHLCWNNHCTPPAGLETVPKMLRRGGYETKAIGKMHFTPTYLDLGFDEMILSEQNGPGRYEDDYHRWLRKHGMIDTADLIDQEFAFRRKAPDSYWQSFGALESNLPETHHSTTWVGDRAVESLRHWQGGGHFLMAGFIKPHHPFDPPPEWADSYNPDELTLLPGWLNRNLERDLAKHPGYFPHEELTETALRKVMAYYYALITQMDFQIGRMIDTLKAQGQYDNTMIVFTSDHGEYLGFHHLLLKGNYMYDPLVKTPLIIKPAGSKGEAVVHDRLVSGSDLAPTILQQADVPLGENMEPVDLIAGQGSRDMVFAELLAEDYMVRTRDFKLLLSKAGDHQLYDLAINPMEYHNVYEHPEYTEVVRDLRKALLDWQLFERPAPNHLDYNATTVAGPNVPDDPEAAQAEMRNFVQAKMGQTMADGGQ